MKKRSDCNCLCHTEGKNIMHCVPCCEPDEEYLPVGTRANIRAAEELTILKRVVKARRDKVNNIENIRKRLEFTNKCLPLANKIGETTLKPEIWVKDVTVLLQEINETNRENKEMIEALKLAYLKHGCSVDYIGWEELTDTLCNTLCNVIGDDGFQELIRLKGESK